MAISETLYSSRSDLWSTPQDFFNKLNDEFHFDLDACAIPSNAKRYVPLEDLEIIEAEIVESEKKI